MSRKPGKPIKSIESPVSVVSEASNPIQPPQNPILVSQDAPRPPKTVRITKSSGHNRFTNEIDYMPYSLRFAKCRAMLDTGATYHEITQEIGLAPATISKVKKGEVEFNDNVAAVIAKHEVNKLTLFSHRILDSIDSDVIEKAPLGARMVAYGIATDKRELLAGRATSRTAIMDGTNAELEAEIAKVQAEIAGLEAALVVDADVVS